jgi:carboxyl-terminal processing protease
MIAGMFFGFKLHQETGTTQGFFKTNKPTSIQEALELIRKNYVDSIGMDTLQQDALNVMMNELDPHSIYIPATNLKEVNEDIIGNFEGIGVEFNIFSDTVHVLFVVPDGPSDKAGLQVGDHIIKVNDSSIVSKTLSSQQIKNMIRGDRGSKVKLTIKRGNTIQDFSITRGTIPLPSVDASYMMGDSTGYIKINKFSEKTYREFMQALEALRNQGLNQLILDLRGNGGGLMAEAVSIADEFLNGDKLIVYTEGTNAPKREYHARRDGIFESGKLVVLVDELTASASEVLAGALQDWGRATIVGRRTFGKGLVQEQYSLSDGSAIRLTVARYYTPLGRSIQRPYDKGKKIYMDEIYDRYVHGEMLYADSNKINIGKAYRTGSGHVVYGGGGIMPDVFVPIDTGTFLRSVTKLYLDGTFNNFVYTYYINRLSQFSQYSSPADFLKRYNNVNDAWNQLVLYALKDSINLKNTPTKDREVIQKRIKAYLAKFKWRTQGYYQVLNHYDPVVTKASEVLSN